MIMGVGLVKVNWWKEWRLSNLSDLFSMPVFLVSLTFSPLPLPVLTLSLLSLLYLLQHKIPNFHVLPEIISYQLPSTHDEIWRGGFISYYRFKSKPQNRSFIIPMKASPITTHTGGRPPPLPTLKFAFSTWRWWYMWTSLNYMAGGAVHIYLPVEPLSIFNKVWGRAACVADAQFSYKNVRACFTERKPNVGEE